MLTLESRATDKPASGFVENALAIISKLFELI